MKEIILKGTFVKEEDNKKVYKLNLGKLDWENFYNIDDDLYFCIKKEDILNDIEKEYLRVVIKPFRDRVKYIEKNDFIKYEYISICVEKDNTIIFPNFKKGTMYKGMEVDKKYTLEELGL
jgi:hypothetical protein